MTEFFALLAIALIIYRYSKPRKLKHDQIGGIQHPPGTVRVGEFSTGSFVIIDKRGDA